ncbi:hypothetical protein [Sulfurospirillum arcachonense]|uniref:hypothetical protein n=1 Tax=Sulfurospirillum arcachonense TaxID=57666 RepID=UPI000469574B|nr:hypothetical protein [Sulfurospirillum arcachonense]
MPDSVLLDDALLLVEQNFYFLHVGEFFGDLSKKEKLSNRDLQVTRTFEESQSYSFNAAIVKELLLDAEQNKNNEITLYEYFVEFNSFRGICMAMVEALRLESPFRSFMQIRLGEQFENFFDLVSFVRNVLSHNIHAQIKLNEKDYEGTLKRIRRMKRDTNISFHLIYARDLPEIGSPDINYGFTCKVDFESLKEGMPFLEIISHWELMMLSELCFNLVMAYNLFESEV